MKTTAYLLTILAIAATFYFAVISMGDKFNMKGLAIIFAVVIPYFLGLGLLFWVKSRTAVITASAVMIILSMLGTYMLYSSIILHPDAQSGLVFFVLPVYQFPIILITAVFAFFMERKAVS
ncbi:hypothetical protein [Sulfurovum sp. NBC37-1]|uniref:hypothetical protein n=1 Tax=Sulfurovum sp. (strain NBC37-1) TaxID=387093 RepID=UPI0001587919|nr:hypothetical protein [Sulfurovum sp. NBC37-1]BAF72039.1 hypothetical protein SUN_1082 [Sulfurovum sp. NBC37-1]